MNWQIAIQVVIRHKGNGAREPVSRLGGPVPHAISIK
jgi:hypothetical protein